MRPKGKIAAGRRTHAQDAGCRGERGRAEEEREALEGGPSETHQMHWMRRVQTIVDDAAVMVKPEDTVVAFLGAWRREREIGGREGGGDGGEGNESKATEDGAHEWWRGGVKQHHPGPRALPYLRRGRQVDWRAGCSLTMRMSPM